MEEHSAAHQSSSFIRVFHEWRDEGGQIHTKKLGQGGNGSSEEREELMCICRVQQRKHVQVFVYTLHNLRFLFYFDLLLTTCDVSRVSADTPPLYVPTLRSWKIKKAMWKEKSSS